MKKELFHDVTREEQKRAAAEEAARIKMVEETRKIIKNDTKNPYEITEDSEYFIIHFPEKDSYIPKKRAIPVVGVEGHISYIELKLVVQATRYFPDESLPDAIEKYKEKFSEK